RLHVIGIEMRARRFAARDLHIDDAIVERSARQEVAYGARKVRFRPGIGDVDLAQAAIHAAVVVEEKRRTLAEELEDFVDGVAELEAAVFHAEDALVGGGEATVEVEDVAHGATAFTMTTVRSSGSRLPHLFTRASTSRPISSAERGRFTLTRRSRRSRPNSSSRELCASTMPSE